MIPLLSALWPGLAGAFLLGLAVGCLTGLPRRRAGPIGLLAATCLVAGLSQSGLVSGVLGLSVDAAALMLPAYLLGCLAGSLAPKLRRDASRNGRV